MEKSLFEQMGGTYTQVGDYLLPNLTLPVEEQKSIGIWGQRHTRYLKQHHKVLYMNLLTSSKLNKYLSDIDEQADAMFLRLVKQMADKQGITEQLKADNQMAWIGNMNNICNSAREIINKNLVPLCCIWKYRREQKFLGGINTYISQFGGLHPIY